MNQPLSNKIVVLGTNHRFQWGELKADEFRCELNRLIEEHQIKLIADEIDNKPSVVKHAADICNIEYIVIEPSPDEKKELGIKEESEIHFGIHSQFELEDDCDFEYWPEDAKKEYYSELESSFRQRELEWLRRIEEVGVWPSLVVCGSSHFEEFSSMLELKGYEVIRTHNYWGKSYIEG